MKLLLYYSSFCALFAFSTAVDVCVKKGPCTCVFPDGKGYDLKPSVQSSFYATMTYQPSTNQTKYELKTFYFNPCSDAAPNVTASDPNDGCSKPLSVYEYVNEFNLLDKKLKTFQMDNGSCNFMGNVNHLDFSDDGRYIKYQNGPSETWIYLICAQGESKLHVYSLENPNQIVLGFYSPDSCLKTIEESGRSFGSTLLIIFFCVVIFYLVLGILTRKFLMGATGLEVIPNLNFWTDLPNLVRDGWAFACNGCKLPVRAVSDQSSYDSI